MANQKKQANSPRACVYVRTSREFKNQERISVDQQIDDAKKAANKEGFDLKDTHIYVDADVSSRLYPKQLAPPGAKKFRPALSRLFDDVAKCRFDTVIVRKLDRLSRLLEMSVAIRKFLSNNNMGIIATHENLPRDASDHTGKVILNMLAVAAEYQLDTITSNIKAAKRYAKDKGLKLGAVRLLGYKDNGNKKVAINPEEAKIVREIFQRYNDGASLVGLAKWLNYNYPDKSKKWRYTQVRDKLTNPHYIGQCRNSKGALINSKVYEPIVSHSEFYTAAKRLESRKNTSVKGVSVVHLLSGMLTCYVCSTRLTPQSLFQKGGKNRKWFAYVCRHSHEDKPFMADEAEWERWINEFIAIAEMPKASEKNEEFALLQIKMASMEKNLAEAIGLASNGAINMTIFKDLTSDLEINIADTKQKIITISQKLSAAPQSVGWNKLSVDEKREWIASVAKKITVARHGVILSLHDDVYLPSNDPTHISNLEGKIYFPLLLVREHYQWKNALVPLNVSQRWIGLQEYIVDGEKIFGPIWDETNACRFYGKIAKDKKQCPRCNKAYLMTEYSGSYCQACMKKWRKDQRQRIK